jgi:hypothetical protein
MNHRTRVYDDILETMPSVENPTPLVRINHLNPSEAFTLYAKRAFRQPAHNGHRTSRTHRRSR